MRAAKRDIAEAAIVKALRDAGCLVMQLDKFDLLVWQPYRGLLMLEVKTGKGGLKPSQLKLLEGGWPLYIVRTPTEALEAVGL